MFTNKGARGKKLKTVSALRATVAVGHNDEEDMAMTERQIDGQYAYGWRFGLGFGAAATVWLIVWFVLAMAAARMAFDSSQKNVRAISKAIAPKVLQAAPKVIAPRQQVIQIPPQSKEACFEESAGVINEQFQQCVSGYSYTVTE